MPHSWQVRYCAIARTDEDYSMARDSKFFARVFAAALSLTAIGTLAVSISATTATVVVAQEPFKQIKLSEPLIKGFIASQKDMAAIAQKIQQAGSDKPDPAIQAELEAIAKKHGFKDFSEYDDVAANISMVMAGIDPQSGQFNDPASAIRKEIEEVKADKTIAEKDKQTMLDELAEALKSTPPVQFTDNIELVKKFRKEIDEVLQ
jgi:hypothetical protein